MVLVAKQDAKIGTVRIDAEVDVTQAEQALDGLKDKAIETEKDVSGSAGEAGKSFGKFGKDVSNSTKQAGDSFSAMTEKLQSDVSRQIGAITGLIGSFTAVVGVATLFVNIGRKVGETLFAQASQAERLKKELDKLPEAYGRAATAYATQAAEGIREIAEESEQVAQRVQALELNLGMTLEEAILRHAQIEDEYSQRAAREQARFRDTAGNIERRFINTALAIQLFATEEEKHLLGLVRGVRSASTEAMAEIELLASETSRALAFENVRGALDETIASIKGERERAISELQQQNRALEDQLLGPLEAQERGLVERLAELNRLMRETTDGEIRDAASRQVELLDEVLANLRDQMKSSSVVEAEIKKLPRTIKESVKQGTREALVESGLLRVGQNLPAIRSNIQRIANAAER